MLGFGNGMSSITQLAKNLLASVDMTEEAEVDGNKSGDNKTIKHTYRRNYQKL